MAPENNLALWQAEPKGPLKIGEAPMPVPGPGEIVVKASHSSRCALESLLT
jgi:NADPH:quinone reductase-like Zn-dependent oxidoreductase